MRTHLGIIVLTSLLVGCQGTGPEPTTTAEQTSLGRTESLAGEAVEDQVVYAVSERTSDNPSVAAETDNETSDTSSKVIPNSGKQFSGAKKGLVMSEKFNALDEMEQYVILHKGTERAFTGEYWETKTAGTYICRRCNAELYRSDDKFESHCGWPSFDDEIEGAVTRHTDADGFRTEIVCTNCGGHLGHVFLGEKFTNKDTRHCVNSISIKLIPKGEKIPAKIVPPAAKSNEEEPASEGK